MEVDEPITNIKLLRTDNKQSTRHIHSVSVFGNLHCIKRIVQFSEQQRVTFTPPPELALDGY